MAAGGCFPPRCVGSTCPPPSWLAGEEGSSWWTKVNRGEHSRVVVLNISGDFIRLNELQEVQFVVEPFK
uniref:Uncharacterized protein n=1 Tax=Oryza meridionalis TaxID=40149 RepID=A0A0E0E952_9ORYZ